MMKAADEDGCPIKEDIGRSHEKRYNRLNSTER